MLWSPGWKMKKCVIWRNGINLIHGYAHPDFVDWYLLVSQGYIKIKFYLCFKRILVQIIWSTRKMYFSSVSSQRNDCITRNEKNKHFSSQKIVASEIRDPRLNLLNREMFGHVWDPKNEWKWRQKGKRNWYFQVEFSISWHVPQIFQCCDDNLKCIKCCDSTHFGLHHLWSQWECQPIC